MKLVCAVCAEVTLWFYKPKGYELSKIRAIIRTGAGDEKNLTFSCDPSGNRLAKKVYNPQGELLYSDYYIRDAQGNVMATYKVKYDLDEETAVYTVDERHIYGSSRVGMYAYQDTIYPVLPVVSDKFKSVWRGYRKYELTNHLGNVMTVVNGHKVPIEGNNGEIAGFAAIVEAGYDYSPFGVTRINFDDFDNTVAETPPVESHPLTPDYFWCLDGDGIESNGSGHNAILHNSSYVEDRHGDAGKALYTVGDSTSYAEIPHHSDLVFGGNDFTVSIWVERLALNNNWNHTIAVGKWHSGQQPAKNEWYLAISNGGSGNNPAQFAIQTGNTEASKFTAAGPSLPVGSWYHLVGVREGNEIKLYVDGVLAGTQNVGSAVVNTIPDRNIFIGRMGNGKHLEANYDEFAIYHRALSDAEISDLYSLNCESFTPTTTTPEIPIAYAGGGYRYGFNTQEKVDEISGKGNHYTAPYWEYSPRLGKRWNLDPKPNPSISSYATYTGNPIMYADPIGDTVQVTFRAGGFLGLRKNTLNYDGGNLYNRDGSNYEGKVSKFGQQTVSALNKLSVGKTGSAALSELISSENVFNIIKTKNISDGNRFVVNSIAQAGLGLNPNVPSGYNISGSGGTIHFNPLRTDGGINTRGLTSRPTFVGLGHELLGHGLSSNRGLADYRPLGPNYPDVLMDEYFASDMENRIRAEHFLPLRAYYGIYNGKGVIPLISNGVGVSSGVHYYNALKMHSIPAKPISVSIVSPVIKR